MEVIEIKLADSVIGNIIELTINNIFTEWYNGGSVWCVSCKPVVSIWNLKKSLIINDLVWYFLMVNSYHWTTPAKRAFYAGFDGFDKFRRWQVWSKVWWPLLPKCDGLFPPKVNSFETRRNAGEFSEMSLLPSTRKSPNVVGSQSVGATCNDCWRRQQPDSKLPWRQQPCSMCVLVYPTVCVASHFKWGKSLNSISRLSTVISFIFLNLNSRRLTLSIVSPR